MDGLSLLSAKAAVLRGRVKEAGILDWTKKLFRMPGTVARGAEEAARASHPLGEVAQMARQTQNIAWGKQLPLPGHPGDARTVIEQNRGLVDAAAREAGNSAYRQQLGGQVLAGGATLGAGALGYRGLLGKKPAPPVEEPQQEAPPPAPPAKPAAKPPAKPAEPAVADDGTLRSKIRRFAGTLASSTVGKALGNFHSNWFARGTPGGQ